LAAEETLVPDVTIDARMLDSSGIGTYLRNLLPRIVQLLPRLKFQLLGDTDKVGTLLGSPENVQTLDCQAPLYSLREQLELINLIPKDTRIFWSPHFNIPLGYRGNLLVTIHDVFHLAVPHYLGGYHKRLYARALFAAVQRKAKAIVCVSEFTRRELGRLLNPRQPVYPIHLGVDEDWFEVPSSPRPHSKPYLVFLGNVKPHKNLRGLLNAFALVAPNHPHDLVVIGQREGFITADRRVADQAQALSDRVIFTGRLSDAELKQYLSHASALVLPSFYEGFGLPPLEAMACGVPTIVSRAASLPEICQGASLYCDPHEPDSIAAAIQALLTDDRLQADLRSKGRIQARQYSWTRCARQTADVIEGMLVS
jgi:glycosyltransferase involved in cell wall biosynthesis